MVQFVFTYDEKQLSYRRSNTTPPHIQIVRKWPAKYVQHNTVTFLSNHEWIYFKFGIHVNQYIGNTNPKFQVCAVKTFFTVLFDFVYQSMRYSKSRGENDGFVSEQN